MIFRYNVSTLRLVVESLSTECNNIIIIFLVYFFVFVNFQRGSGGREVKKYLLNYRNEENYTKSTVFVVNPSPPDKTRHP